jgi:hypothetical protein
MMNNKFTQNDEACTILDNITKSVHLTVSLLIIGWDVSSAIWMFSEGVK